VTDPYVVLGLARTRQPWLAELTRWATSGAAPLEVAKCLTAEEARAALGSGRRFSVLVADVDTPGLDRDLISTAAALSVPTLVVLDGRVRRDFDSLGCAALVERGFSVERFVSLLEDHARPVERTIRRPARVVIDPDPRRSHVIGVTGAGGTGSSTVAMGLAQSLGRSHPGGALALVDGCRTGDLAMYHDIGDVIPGLPELVECHRVDEPDPDAVRSLLHPVEDRGYDLLLGLRTPRDWVAMRPASLRGALDGLQRTYDVVVVDHDPDLEGEAVTGSAGVEDRHGIARATAHRADLMVAVGIPGLKGTTDLARLISALTDEDVPPARILPVVNRCPRNPALRSSVVRALHDLTAANGIATAAPLFLSVRGLESAHRSAVPLPEALCRPLGRAAQRLLLAQGPRARASGGSLVTPGDLGTSADPGWWDEPLHPASGAA
jgi:hypothetical protein